VEIQCEMIRYQAGSERKRLAGCHSIMRVAIVSQRDTVELHRVEEGLAATREGRH